MKKGNKMKGELKLKNPVKINNVDVDTMTYDTEEITGDLFIQAEAKQKNACGRNAPIVPAIELDYGLHLYMGFAAIIAVNSSYDFSDLERIKGEDLLNVMVIGRNFILRSESRPQNSTAKLPEDTPERSAQASAKSEAGK